MHMYGYMYRQHTKCSFMEDMWEKRVELVVLEACVGRPKNEPV